MSNPDILSVKITGDEAGLKAALENGIQDLNRFSTQTDNVLKKIEHNTGGSMLFFQKLTVVAHGVVAVIRSISGLFGSFMQQAQSIEQMSHRLGIARSELEMFKYAAEQSGFSVETVADAMKKFSTTLGAANLGNEGARDKLFSVGIDSKSFDGKSISEQFDMLADHIAAIPDSTERVHVEIELFGESGFRLLPMLEKEVGR